MLVNSIMTGLMGSNRTFMELKQLASSANLDSWQGSNRTFMELKQICLLRTSKSILVLIVPLWN